VIAPVLAVSGVFVTASTAQAASASVVISEVYGGGGNSGAPWKSDFVELYNGSDVAVDVAGWVVQYFSSGGGAGGKATLAGSVPAHHAFLVQMATNADSTATPLPTRTRLAAGLRPRPPGRAAQHRRRQALTNQDCRTRVCRVPGERACLPATFSSPQGSPPI
jgi:hypothetical protein